MYRSPGVSGGHVSRITKNPVDDIKCEAIWIIETINAATKALHLLPIVGDYDLGYIYRNVKTHKPGNPLHPIIRQIPALTYQLAKKLVAVLTPYIPDDNSLKSSAEFIEDLRTTPPGGVITSMDVESLFTNVPLDEAIQIILDRVYRDDSMPPLNIPEHALWTPFEICTKKALFSTHRGHMHIQKDSVAMGSPLGVLFTNFYMGVVEHRVFATIEKPSMCVWYIDDTFISASTEEEIEHLPFLDVLVGQQEECFVMQVYMKPTNGCVNGESECPERYKCTAISTFIRRALSHCSSWKGTHTEL
ncbi:uncharacterized protein [Macrobrachium rosenbergii]|uniref:uncharacterized protein n=1 Tax=Macrobrachium rosenbergii TaxID=79674 RepID=UPI0034D698FB